KVLNGAAARALYRAECARSKQCLRRAPIAPREPIRLTAQTRSHFCAVPVKQNVFLDLPRNVDPSESLDFRLTVEFTNLPRRCRVLVLLQCCGGPHLELKRWLLLRPCSRRRYVLTGKIDGSLIVARGIDRIWLTVAMRPPNETTMTKGS